VAVAEPAGDDRAAAPTAPSDWILGIDEAGRGSVLGPLVVGAYLIPAGQAERLPALGVRDSKLLTPEQRAAAFREIGALGRRLHVSLLPPRIDAFVQHHDLNLLEAQAFARLVRRAGTCTAYVDACDPIARRFGLTVARLARVSPSRIISQHHADRDLPVVAAASIVAKVRRDRAIAQLRARLGCEIGTGYPSDPRTRAFVRAWLADGVGAAPWLRQSWRTTEILKPKPATRTLETFFR
jgi:ribonuclease HII